ncbi:MAG: outer membrane lipoprotein carrier protein LolA [Alloalcanivorax sp.]
MSRSTLQRIATLILALPLFTHALTLSEIEQQLDPAPVLKAGFRQQQHLAMLSRPLVSTGSLLLIKGHGLQWQMKTPFTSDLKLIDGTLYSNGQADNLPGGEAFSRRLMMVLSGDFSALQKVFEIEVSGEPERWTLTLEPRNATLKKVLHGLSVSGGRSPEQFRLDYPNGDYSVTTLSNIQLTDTPTAGEEQRLARP